MKIYITGLPSGYEVEHLVRLFYPMAPLTLTPPEEGEDCVWAEKKEDSLYAMVREQGQSRDAVAPLPRPVEAGGETVEFTLASLTYDLLRSWTGIRPPWGKMTGVRPVRLIHDKRAAGWTEADIDRFFLERFDCSRQKYDMAKAIADLQEPILKLGSAPKTYSLYLGIPFCPSRCSYCSFVSCNLDRDRKLVQPYVDCLCRDCLLYTSFPCEALVFAVGHSARDTFGMLMDSGLVLECKPFSVGFRAEHLQSEIEKSLYHEAAGHPALPRGEYQLSQHVGDRCVYTFCMCPGGQVVASASETGHVVTNGMSYHARDGKNANAAVVVSVGAEDFAGDPRRAIAFQRELEAKAYAAGCRGGAYAAPAENVQSFLEGKGQLNIGRCV